MKALAKKSTANRRKEHDAEKYIQWVTTLSLTIRLRLAVVASQICKIPLNSLKIRTYTVQGHPRSLILMSIECDFLLVINTNFGRICYRFRAIDA